MGRAGDRLAHGGYARGAAGPGPRGRGHVPGGRSAPRVPGHGRAHRAGRGAGRRAGPDPAGGDPGPGDGQSGLRRAGLYRGPGPPGRRGDAPLPGTFCDPGAPGAHPPPGEHPGGIGGSHRRGSAHRPLGYGGPAPLLGERAHPRATPGAHGQSGVGSGRDLQPTGDAGGGGTGAPPSLAPCPDRVPGGGRGSAGRGARRGRPD